MVVPDRVVVGAAQQALQLRCGPGVRIAVQVAAAGAQELLARLHHYRYSLSKHPTNRDFEIQRWELVDGTYQHESDQSEDKRLMGYIGRGDMEPFLDMPEFSAIKTLQPA